MSDDTATLRDVTLAPGTMVGEYRVERLIGQGTFGEVYAAEHPLIGKMGAVKLLREDLSSQPDVVARFTAEARAVNLINHRHIVDVFSFGTFGARRCYFVMELLEGLTLGALLDQQRRLDPTQALPILRDVADALDAAHRAGVVHRDLKPDNVFLVPDASGGYTPKLLDFGVAKLSLDEMGIKTATGTALGTPRYMSPEQCRGKNVDHRTDIYALGAMAHQMLTGEPPFDADSPTVLLLKQTVDPPPRMSSVHAALPPELDAPVLAMLAKRPADRPASAGKAVAALAAALSGVVSDQARARSMNDTLPLGSRMIPAPPSGRTIKGQPVTARLPEVAPAAEVPALSATMHSEAPARRARGASAGAAASGEGTLPASSDPSVSVKIPMSRVSPAIWVAGVMALAAIGVGASAMLRGRPEVAAPALSAERVIRALPTATACATAAGDAPVPSAAPVVSSVSTGSVAVATVTAPVAPPATAARVRAAGRSEAAPRPTATVRPVAHDIGF